MNKSIFKTFIFFFFLTFLSGCNNQEFTLYTETFNFFEKDIEVKIYTTSEKKAKKAFEEIGNIYDKYEQIASRTNKDSEISYIHNNELKEKTIKISDEMTKLINTGIEWNKKSEGLININSGAIIDLWNDKYDYNLIPTQEELESLNINMDDINIHSNRINNNHYNLSFDNYINGYTHKEVKNYLESINIKSYFINAGSEVMVGKGYNNENYNIAISNPFDDTLLHLFSVQDKYIVTKSIYYNSYKYEDKLYSSILNPKTKYMSDKMVNVTVVSDDAITGDMLATILFLMDINDGKEFIKKYDVQAIWCYYDENGNEIVEKTDNL